MPENYGVPNWESFVLVNGTWLMLPDGAHNQPTAEVVALRTAEDVGATHIRTRHVSSGDTFTREV